MIRYSLKCAAGHAFDSWFRDSAAFDSLAAQRRVACAVCGGTEVEKALMAPSVRAEERVQPPADTTGTAAPSPGGSPEPLTTPPTPAERALAKLRQYLSDHSDYVGRRFAEEARRMHLGDAEERAIWGEASLEDARALAEDGVPVLPLPALPRRDD